MADVSVCLSVYVDIVWSAIHMEIHCMYCIIDSGTCLSVCGQMPLYAHIFTLHAHIYMSGAGAMQMQLMPMMQQMSSLVHRYLSFQRLF